MYLHPIVANSARPAKTRRRLNLAARIRYSLWIQSVLALVVFLVMWLLVTKWCKLPLQAYQGQVLTIALLTDLNSILMIGIIMLAAIAFREELSWKTLDLGRGAHLFVMGAAAILVWPFSALDYNFFFDHTYAVDRLILLLLWALIYLHPLFVAPLLLVLAMLIFQLHYPLTDADWHWPDKRLPVDFLVMFCSFLAIRPLFGRHRQAFVLLTLTLVGSHYFHAGLNKLLLGPHLWSWIVGNHLSHIFAGSYINGGWLRPLDESTVHRLADWLRVFDPITACLTVMIECGTILLLLHRRLVPWLLLASVGLHLGILALSGIFFWKWIAFDLMLLLWLSRSWRSDDFIGQGQEIGVQTSPAGGLRRWLMGRGLFSANVFILFIFLVYCSKFLLRVPFAWWDTPYINFFEIRGVGYSGAEYILDSRFFSPYDIVIHQARFYYLKNGEMIGGTYAVSHDYDFARAVEHATPADIEAIRKRFGKSYDKEAAISSTERLTIFVSQYVNNASRHGRKHWWINRVAPPYHFQTWRAPNAYNFQEPLREAYVQHIEVLDWQGKFYGVGNTRVLDIPLR